MHPHKIAAFALSLALPLASHAQCMYQGGHSLDITLSGKYLEPMVKGRINGTEAPLLVATGAYRSFLTARYAQKLGIPSRAERWTETMGNDKKAMRTARVSELSVGPSKPYSGNFSVIGEYHHETPYAVILGMDFFNQADFLLDINERFLQFFYPKNCSKTAVLFPDALVLKAYWPDHDPRAVFTLKVNDVELPATINTSTRASILNPLAAKRLGIAPANPGEEFLHLAKLEIGKDVYSDIRIQLGKEDLGEHDLILGIDFLMSHRVLFARSQDRVYLTRHAPLKFEVSEADTAVFYEAEAARGNAGAKAYLAELLFQGKGIAKDTQRATVMMNEAAAQGDYSAKQYLALEDFIAGAYAKAADSLRALSAAPAASRNSDLMYYLARAHNGDQAGEKIELKDLRKQAATNQWPLPVIDYLLDSIDDAGLLGKADKKKSQHCEAHFFIGQAHLLRGDSTSAGRAFREARSACKATDFEYRASGAAIKKLEGS